MGISLWTISGEGEKCFYSTENNNYPRYKNEVLSFRADKQPIQVADNVQN